MPFKFNLAPVQHGSLFWAMPTLVMELFGAKHFGANRGLVGLSPAIGGYLLSTLLAGKVYAVGGLFNLSPVDPAA